MLLRIHRSCVYFDRAPLTSVFLLFCEADITEKNLSILFFYVPLHFAFTQLFYCDELFLGFRLTVHRCP